MAVLREEDGYAKERRKLLRVLPGQFGMSTQDRDLLLLRIGGSRRTLMGGA